MDLIIKSFELPFSGFSYLNFFRSADVMTRNLANAESPGTVTGVPVQNSGYIRCTGGQTDYVSTGVGETGTDMTLAVVVRSFPEATSAAQNAIFIGNYLTSSLGNMGLNIYGNGPLSIRSSAFGDETATQPSLATVTADWNLYVLRANDTTLRLENLTTGTFTEAEIYGGRDTSSPRNFRLGSGHGSGFPAECDIASAAVIERRISDSETVALHAMMRRAAIMDGIVI